MSIPPVWVMALSFCYRWLFPLPPLGRHFYVVHLTASPVIFVCPSIRHVLSRDIGTAKVLARVLEIGPPAKIIIIKDRLPPWEEGVGQQITPRRFPLPPLTLYVHEIHSIPFPVIVVRPSPWHIFPRYVVLSSSFSIIPESMPDVARVVLRTPIWG